ncbi:MAG: L-glutamate gamma-semialdehyde dehydrogenase [Candidatus Korobacteraceae bacterium]
MATTTTPAREGTRISATINNAQIPTTFKNEPSVDFSNPENARRMRTAIEKVRNELGREYDLVIGGRHLKTAEKTSSINPSKPSEIVGIHQAAGASEVEPAMQAALKAFETWKFSSIEERTNLLFRVSALLRERKFELMAWMIFEVGKNWAEADGDIAELIDFCDFYALEALRLSKTTPPVQLPGERDHLRYIPLGVGAVIPPWNFPGAIMGGMTLASVVAGNTVIVKPSGDSPTIAAKFFEILEEAGLPDGVVNFCPGHGNSFGNAIVEHPKTRYIAFTGSKEVGLHINQRAAVQQSGQIWIKRTILEMGGKDSIVVDTDSDLDAAVEGVASSAFGFSGQKCSACSRAIVDERVYDKFLQRLKERVEKITVGDPTQNLAMGPVVNEKSMQSILGYIEKGIAEGGRLITGGARATEAGDGFFIEPTVIADVDPMATISQQEIFGPVLAVIKSRGFEHGLQIANNTEFGLTGAVYTTSEDKIEAAKEQFHVGNLYINRKCTGAMVGAHPFGGFNMSGTDSKAGGPDYLLLFTQAKSIGEKIRR